MATIRRKVSSAGLPTCRSSRDIQGMVRLAWRYSTMFFSKTLGNSAPRYLVAWFQSSVALRCNIDYDIRGRRVDGVLVHYPQVLDRPLVTPRMLVIVGHTETRASPSNGTNSAARALEQVFNPPGGERGSTKRRSGCACGGAHQK